EVGVGELGLARDVGNQFGLDVPRLGSDGLVVRQGDAREVDVGTRVEDAPTQGHGAEGAHRRCAGGQAVGDGQVVDGDVGVAAADVEDSRAAAAADREFAGPRPVNRQVAGDG